MTQSEVLPLPAQEMLIAFLERNIAGQFVLHITPGKERGLIRVAEVIDKKQVRLDNCDKL